MTQIAAPYLLGHVKKLFSRVFELGVKVKLTLFDRGYYSAELIRYLDSLKVRYVMQIPAYTDVEDGEDRTYVTTGHRRRRGEQATFRLVAIKGKNKGGKDKLFTFATNTDMEPNRMRQLFRKRWGIETSYRMIRMFLAKTTSKLYRLRILYFQLAVLLYNLWVTLNHNSRAPRMIADALRLHVKSSLILLPTQDTEVTSS